MWPVLLLAQEPQAGDRIMFYNVENLFDPFDDPATRDEEYTPDGTRSWTYGDFMEKAVRMARAILAAGSPEPPSVIGLAEVENRFVLDKLVGETPLEVFGYRVIHGESPDPRGIDVALLFREDRFRLDTFHYERVILADSGSRTRDILLVHGSLRGAGNLTIAVNHWPSRYGGAAGSQSRRMAAANTLKRLLDSLLTADPCANVIVMGDFNDCPEDPSMQLITSGKDSSAYRCRREMINLMPLMENPTIQGSIKFEGHWYFFDQIIVSRNMADGLNGMTIKNKKAALMSAAFLLETDNSHLGVKPYRGFSGPANHHGFSDHLPVFVDVIVNQGF